MSTETQLSATVQQSARSAYPFAAAPGDHAISLETIGLCKTFGTVSALDNVSIKVTAGSFHALLGENGAGKSTLVKCLMGVYAASAGQLIVNNREVTLTRAGDAQALGLGMVYQHFTLVPSLTAAENLVISKPHGPAFIDWTTERQQLQQFMGTMPFSINLFAPVSTLSAGEKQKLEILKQLYLGNRFLVLDEPTSVLTPDESKEVLTLVRRLCSNNGLTVLMITHKFHEVSSYADDLSVLRQGRYTGGGKVADITHQQMAAMMMGSATEPAPGQSLPHSTPSNQPATTETPVLKLVDASCKARSKNKKVHIERLVVKAGEIVGIAGVSGNGQSELMEMLAGQRSLLSGQILVDEQPFSATRAQLQSLKVRFIPEEPLHNASAASMSVADNLCLRDYDTDNNGRQRFWLDPNRLQSIAAERVKRFNIKTASLASPLSSLSGGNVQRTVLARELSGDVRLLIIANPCFGLDFNAVAEIRTRLNSARNNGTAILLISEDLDEILALADQVLVICDGRINYSCSSAQCDIEEIGRHMAGHSH